MSVNLFFGKPWQYACEPFRVSPHVYYVGNRDVGSYLVKTRKGLVLIDQGYAETVFYLLESIRKLGFDPADICALLVSHGHIDHCGGTQLIKQHIGAPVYMSREDYEMYQANVDYVRLDYENWIDYEPDVFYDYNVPLDFGDLKIEVMHTPGHTPGTCSFFMTDYDENGKTYRLGLYGGIGLNTQYPEFLAKYPAWPTTLLEDFIDSLLKCRDFAIDITLPSHPNHTVPGILEVLGDADDFSRFVNADLWPQMIDRRLKMAYEMKENRTK